MNLPISFVIAHRYSQASKNGKFVGLISLFSKAGIMLGVMALIIVISVMDGFENILKERILGSVTHVSISMPSDSPLEFDYIAERKKLASLPNNIEQQITQALPQLNNTAILQLPTDLRGIQVQGLFSNETIPQGLLNAASLNVWQTMFDNKYSVIVGRYWAFEHGLRVGERVRIIASGASHYTPLGRMPAQRVFTIAGFFETKSDIDQQVVFVNSNDLNRIIKRPVESAQSLKLVLAEPFDAKDIESQLTAIFPLTDYTLSNWHDTHGKLFDAVKMEKNMMWFMLSLIVAVAAFNIVSALVMMVTQKQAEIAILKTLGLNQIQIAKIFTLQGTYNGVVGTVIGGVLGCLIVLGLNDFMLATGINLLGVPGVGLPVSLSIYKVLLIGSFSISLAFFASIYPAIKAAKLAPADVLRYE